MSTGKTSPAPWRWDGEEDDWRLVDAQTADVLVATTSYCGAGEEVGIRANAADRALIASAPTLLRERDEAVALMHEFLAWYGPIDPRDLGLGGHKLAVDIAAFLARLDGAATP